MREQTVKEKKRLHSEAERRVDSLSDWAMSPECRRANLYIESNHIRLAEVALMDYIVRKEGEKRNGTDANPGRSNASKASDQRT